LALDIWEGKAVLEEEWRHSFKAKVHLAVVVSEIPC